MARGDLKNGIIRLADGTRTIRQIADELGATYISVNGQINRLGLRGKVKNAIARRADLAQAPAPVRVLMDELAESRKYALALEEELRARTERLDQLLLLANSMDTDFQSYAEAHPASMRITGPNSDGEYWLHIKAGGRDGGINLGVDHGPICKRLLDAATETGAKK